MRCIINNKINRVGETKLSKCGTLGKIIEYNSYSDIIVEFQDEYKYKLHTTYRNWELNQFKNPYDKCVYGIACIGNAKGSQNGIIKKSYKVWYSMLNRCYSEKLHKKEGTYIDCEVCKEWLCYEEFEKWFDNNYYQIGNEKMSLDKDILVKNNKLYCPERCVFVPQNINNLFIKSDKARGDLPIGVSYNRSRNNFVTQCCKANGVRTRHYFRDKIEAFNFYKNEKEDYIKEVANLYKKKIPEKLYIAMMNYKVEIND